jgi:hypothetical protein
VSLLEVSDHLHDPAETAGWPTLTMIRGVIDPGQGVGHVLRGQQRVFDHEPESAEEGAVVVVTLGERVIDDARSVVDELHPVSVAFGAPPIADCPIPIVRMPENEANLVRAGAAADPNALRAFERDPS